MAGNANVVNAVRRMIEDDAEEDALIAAIVQHFADGDNLDRNRRRIVFVDIEGWRRFDGISFKEHFRMSRPVFQKLVVTVGLHMRRRNRWRYKKTPLDVSLLMAIWVLFNPDTFRSCGSQFGVARSVIQHHYSYCIEAIAELAPKFVKWPSRCERDIIRHRFEDKYRYPGVVGCIDGTHIEMTAPLDQPQRYVNRHHKYSILVQAVADHRLLYRDLYVGQPGSVGDARMFDRSPLSDNLLRRRELLEDDKNLLGDGAYTLTSKIIIPYVNNNLSQRQRTHNFHLSETRASVERSFALLMGKMRRLKFFPNYSIPICMDHIMTSFVLHNFIILDGEEPDGLNGNGIPVGVHLIDPNEDLVAQAVEDGAAKREYIARLLSPDPDPEPENDDIDDPGDQLAVEE